MKNLKSALSQKSDSQTLDSAAGIVCASIRKGSPTLVVIAREGRRWIMPWVHFLYAWHEYEEKFERIEMSGGISDETVITIAALSGVLLENVDFGFPHWCRSFYIEGDGSQNNPAAEKALSIL